VQPAEEERRGESSAAGNLESIPENTAPESDRAADVDEFTQATSCVLAHSLGLEVVRQKQPLYLGIVPTGM
jgi:hypothetical protein